MRGKVDGADFPLLLDLCGARPDLMILMYFTYLNSGLISIML